MEGKKRRSLGQIYRNLKLDYFDLPKKVTEKGDVRAFVGEKTWIYERSKLEKGEDPYGAHINAFSDAIRECRKALEANKLQEELGGFKQIL
jgi:hypothetical protein